MASPSKSVSSSGVSNEDIINELTKDLEKDLQSSSISDKSPTSSQTDESESFVIEPDGRGNDNATNSDLHFKPTELNKNKENDIQFDVDNFDKDERPASDSEEQIEDFESGLKEIEDSLSAEEKEERRSKAEMHKNEGNEKFKIGQYEESILHYIKGLKICPLMYCNDRAVLYSNCAASKMKLDKNKDAIKDCTKSIEFNPNYVKAYYRRAQCYELTDSLDDSLVDYKKILEMEPQHSEAKKAIIRLPPLIEERNEKLKTEMMSKLKDLGNLVLRPFGLSTENFQLTQDPETKGYSINFQQKK